MIAAREDVVGSFLRLCDPAGAALRDFTTGANDTDWHVTGANWGTQYDLPEEVDVRQARAGEAALHDDTQVLQSARGSRWDTCSSWARGTRRR